MSSAVTLVVWWDAWLVGYLDEKKVVRWAEKMVEPKAPLLVAKRVVYWVWMTAVRWGALTVAWKDDWLAE